MLLKNRILALFIAALLVIGGIFIGYIRSFKDKANELERIFESDGGISSKIDELETRALNLTAVALRYEMNSAAGALYTAIDSLSMAVTPAERLAGVDKLKVAFDILFEAIPRDGTVANEHLQLINIYYGEFHSLISSLPYDEYNYAAMKYNQAYDSSLVQFTFKLFGIKRAELY